MWEFLFNLLQVKGKKKGIKYPDFSEPVSKARAGDSDCEELYKGCLCIYCYFLFFAFQKYFFMKRVNFKHKRSWLYRMRTPAELNKYYSTNLELQIRLKSNLRHRKEKNVLLIFIQVNTFQFWGVTTKCKEKSGDKDPSAEILRSGTDI